MEVEPTRSVPTTSSPVQTSSARENPTTGTKSTGSGAQLNLSFADKHVDFGPSKSRTIHHLPKRPAPAIDQPSPKRVRTKRGKPRPKRSSDNRPPAQVARQLPHQQPSSYPTTQIDSLSVSISKLLIGPDVPSDSFDKSVILLLSGLVEKRSSPIVSETPTSTRGPHNQVRHRPAPIRPGHFNKSAKGPATASNALSIGERRSKELFPLPKVTIPDSSVSTPLRTA
jgi:hypothetical protein